MLGKKGLGGIFSGVGNVVHGVLTLDTDKIGNGTGRIVTGAVNTATLGVLVKKDKPSATQRLEHDRQQREQRAFEAEQRRKEELHQQRKQKMAARAEANKKAQINKALSAANDHLAKEEVKEAEECLHSVLMVEPTHLIAHDKLAKLMAKQERYLEEADHLKVCYGHNKDKYALRWANALYHSNDYHTAADVYHRVFYIHKNDFVFVSKVFDCAVKCNNVKLVIASHKKLCKENVLTDKQHRAFDEFKQQFFSSDMSDMDYCSGIQTFLTKYRNYDLTKNELAYLQNAQEAVYHRYETQLNDLAAVEILNLTQARHTKQQIDAISTELLKVEFLKELHDRAVSISRHFSDEMQIKIEKQTLVRIINKIGQRFETSCKRHFLPSMKVKLSLIANLLSSAERYFSHVSSVDIIEFLQYVDGDSTQEDTLAYALQYGRWGASGVAVRSFADFIEALNTEINGLGTLVKNNLNRLPQQAHSPQYVPPNGDLPPTYQQATRKP